MITLFATLQLSYFDRRDIVSSRKERENNAAQERGSKGNLLDYFAEMINPLTSIEEKRSFENGYLHQPKKPSIWDPESKTENRDEKGANTSSEEELYPQNSSESILDEGDNDYYDDDDDDYYDDDDEYYSPIEYEPPPEPKPEPIVSTTYERTKSGYTATTITLNFENEAEKEKYLRLMALAKELDGVDYEESEEDSMQRELAEIDDLIHSDSVWDTFIAILRLTQVSDNDTNE